MPRCDSPTALPGRWKKPPPAGNRSSAPCKTINSPLSNYRSSCGCSLTAGVIPTQEGMQKDILGNPGVPRSLLTGLIEEKRKNGSL